MIALATTTARDGGAGSGLDQSLGADGDFETMGKYRTAFEPLFLSIKNSNYNSDHFQILAKTIECLIDACDGYEYIAESNESYSEKFVDELLLAFSLSYRNIDKTKNDKYEIYYITNKIFDLISHIKESAV